MNYKKRALFKILLSGIFKKCPKCGNGKVFSGYLKIIKNCKNCNEDLSIYRTDDFGPWLSIILGGHIIVPLVLAVEQKFAPEMWIQTVVWIPLTLIIVLLLLPISKSICLAILWNLKD